MYDLTSHTSNNWVKMKCINMKYEVHKYEVGTLPISISFWVR